MARPIKTTALAATAAVLVALTFAEVSLCEPAAAREGDSPVFAARGVGQLPASEGDSPVFAARGLGQLPTSEGDSPVFAARGVGQFPASEGDSPVFAARKSGQSPASGQSPTSADGDFRRRCQAPGVVRYFDFDTQEEADPHIYPPSGQRVKRGKIVRDVKASGGGSLCFEIPSNTPADTSGSFWLNFKDDLSAQFGQRDEFYVQWRQRFSPEFLNTKYQGGGGWKQVIIGEGDRPGKTAYSCTQLEIVVVNGYHKGIVQMYHSCGGKDGQYEGLEVFDPKVNDILLQNACGCRYQQPTIPPCVGYQADQWMTFQVHVKIGTWYKNDKRYRRDSTIELWVAEEGQPSKPVISRTDYDIANNNPAAKYGKIWLLPYNTGKDASQAHPTAYTWYDELIVSKQRIPDPAVRPSP